MKKLTAWLLLGYFCSSR